MPIDAVRELVAGAGVHGRRVRAVVALLTGARRSTAELVLGSGVERRTVEAVLAAAGDDLDRTGAGVRVRPECGDAYRDLADAGQLAATAPADPYAAQLAEAADLVAELARLIADAPAARRPLDHVAATAGSVVRRALHLRAHYDLAGARVLCLGDHDLTSLAVAALAPDAEVTVVDVDEGVLGYVDAAATRTGRRVRCRWADLRFGLPASAREAADLVVTDPPYTPEGVRLFALRGLEALRDRDAGRLLVAYGYAAGHPGLGLKVQQALSGLHLAYEAVLPGFHAYHGAQAVGSRSDLYVLRPTARSRAAVESAAREPELALYTHGPQAQEGIAATDPVATAALLAAAAGSPGGASVPLAYVGSAPPPDPAVAHVRLGTVLAAGLPPHLAGRTGGVAVDLTADPGAWLARVLLAAGADRLALLVRADHPDLAGARARDALAALVASRYRLAFGAGTPDAGHALVTAERVDAVDLDPAGTSRRRLLDRAHGKLANVRREALVDASRRAGGAVLTKNAARERVVATASRPDDELPERLLDLPRHRVAAVLDEAAAAADTAAPDAEAAATPDAEAAATPATNDLVQYVERR